MTDTAHTFISSSFQKILSTAKKDKKQTNLIEKCNEALEVLKKLSSGDTTQKQVKFPYEDRINIISSEQQPADIDPIFHEWDVLANLLVEPLLISCETHQHNLVEPALDCLQKLMDYGYIRERTPDISKGENGTLIARVIKCITECSKYPLEGRLGESVQLQIIKAFSTSITQPSCGVHDTNLMDAIRTVYNIYLSSNNEVNRTTAKGALTHMLNTIFFRLEKSSQSSDNNNQTSLDELPTEKNEERNGEVSNDDIDSDNESKLDSANIDPLYHDCRIVFRNLCRLAKKEVIEGSTTEVELKSKILSLELILGLLDNPTSRITNQKFIYQNIKSQLSFSLCNSIFSTNPKVFRLSLWIFLSLITNYRMHLKNEIGTFFGIYLHILQSASSSINQKWVILQGLYKICKIPQILVDFFINYDCDMDEKDLFGQIVEALSRLAQRSNESDPLSSPTQWASLNALALECLVTIAQSLVEWSKPLYVPPPHDSTIGSDMEDNIERVPLVLPPDVDKFRKQKEQKTILEHGKNLFKLNPKLGIRYLQDNNVVGESPESIAEFLRFAQGLDKTKAGEYLGALSNIQILYSYIDNHFDFTNQQIDIALREFLQWFRLPGEAQQIDRMMEKFALRYFTDNTGGRFVSSDAVYFLAFAVIMLATDHHNPMVISKIKLSEWKKNLLEQTQYCFDAQLLDEVYDRVCAEPLKLSNDDGITPSLSRATFLNEKHKFSVFTQEADYILKKATTALKSRIGLREEFHQFKEVDHVHPMFEECWGSMLAAFSVILEMSEDPKLISLCLNGIKASIRVSCVFNLITQCDAFIRALTKFTSLIDNVHEIQDKHIEAINELINICSTDGNYLGNSWRMVLRCISQLERMISGSSTKVDVLIIDTQKQLAEGLSRKNATTIAERIRESDIDLIFSNSRKLASYAVVDMTRCLCELSKEELAMRPPRTFSLQKVVELAIENLQRSRTVWAALWILLGDHFSFAVSHHNKRVATFAINSLKQLCLKFMEDERLSGYSFQQVFLKPFEMVANTRSRSLREYVIEILSAMITSKSAEIKSGWRSVLNVFAQQASVARSEKIVTRTFSMLESIVIDYFTLITEEFFGDLITTLSAYASKHRGGEFSMKAIKLIRYCANRLAAGVVCPLIYSENSNEMLFSGSVKSHIDLWISVTNNFVKTVTFSTVDNRLKALKTLFKLLHQHGHLFNVEMWKLLFKESLIHLFDNVKSMNKILSDENTPLSIESNDWLLTTCFKALHEIVVLFEKFYDKISILLEDILKILVDCIVTENETLATFGITTFDTLLSSNCKKFTSENWHEICDILVLILQSNIPNIDLSKISITDNTTAPSYVPPPPISVIPPASDSKKNFFRSVTTIPKRPSKFDDKITRRPTLPSNISSSLEIKSENVGDSVFSAPRISRRRRPSSAEKIAEDSSEESSIPLDSDQKNPELVKTIMPRDTLERIVGRCFNQNSVIKLINEQIVNKCFPYLEMSHITIILDGLQECYQFSCSLTESYRILEELARANRTALLDQISELESESMNTYLRILFRILEVEEQPDFSESEEQNFLLRQKFAEQHLFSACTIVVKSYMAGMKKLHQINTTTTTTTTTPSPSTTTQSTPTQSASIHTLSKRLSRNPSNKSYLRLKRTLEAKVPIILLILEKLTSFPDEKLEKNLPFYFPIICDLTLSNSLPLRSAIRTALLRIGQLKIGQFLYEISDFFISETEDDPATSYTATLPPFQLSTPKRENSETSMTPRTNDGVGRSRKSVTYPRISQTLAPPKSRKYGEEESFELDSMEEEDRSEKEEPKTKILSNSNTSPVHNTHDLSVGSSETPLDLSSQLLSESSEITISESNDKIIIQSRNSEEKSEKPLEDELSQLNSDKTNVNNPPIDNNNNNISECQYSDPPQSISEVHPSDSSQLDVDSQEHELTTNDNSNLGNDTQISHDPPQIDEFDAYESASTTHNDNEEEFKIVIERPIEVESKPTIYGENNNQISQNEDVQNTAPFSETPIEEIAVAVDLSDVVKSEKLLNLEENEKNNVTEITNNDGVMKLQNIEENQTNQISISSTDDSMKTNNLGEEDQVHVTTNQFSPTSSFDINTQPDNDLSLHSNKSLPSEENIGVLMDGKQDAQKESNDRDVEDLT